MFKYVKNCTYPGVYLICHGTWVPAESAVVGEIAKTEQQQNQGCATYGKLFYTCVYLAIYYSGNKWLRGKCEQRDGTR